MVEAIDAAAYHGAIGDPIVVRVVEDFETVGVTVTLRAANEAMIETGAAMEADGQWRYAASTVIPVGTTINVEAVVTDRPGHSGMLRQQIVVA